jgi:hypothetical protein
MKGIEKGFSGRGISVSHYLCVVVSGHHLSLGAVMLDFIGPFLRWNCPRTRRVDPA